LRSSLQHCRNWDTFHRIPEATSLTRVKTGTLAPAIAGHVGGPEMRIYEAAEAVLRESDKPMPVKQIYEAITARDLFQFGAKSPLSVLSQTLRDRSVGGRSRAEPIFVRAAPGTYGLVEPRGSSEES